MHGARRVAVFCLLIAILPTILLIIPLYLRHSVFIDVVYSVAESDVLEMVEGMSTIFCQGQTLRMNSSFSAFQIKGPPEPQTENKKHIRLKKSMSLPDDTLEYWGFYLPNGSTVDLAVCSRWDGSRILVVKGEKNLRTCGLLNHPVKSNPRMASDHNQVLVTFETNAQVILSDTNIDKDFGQNLTEAKDFEGEDFTDYDNLEARKKNEEIKNKNIRILSKQEKIANESKNKSDVFNESKSTVAPKLRRRRRHEKTKSKLEEEKELLTKLLNEDVSEVVTPRKKRFAKAAQQSHRFDGGFMHGGNAYNYNDSSHDSAFSSFEYGLYTCYAGNILLTQGFQPSEKCESVDFLDKHKHKYMKTKHEVVSDGYYYYIFYSDNDRQSNDIHAVFDIYKPTYLYGNFSNGCINKTECYFPIKFLSDETVVVEVPTRDGIEHEGDDITQLTSTCHPRVAVYMLFPISILFLILSCAFL